MLFIFCTQDKPLIIFHESYLECRENETLPTKIAGFAALQHAAFLALLLLQNVQQMFFT